MMPQEKKDAQGHSDYSWRKLHSVCDCALALSQEVADHLRKGTPARELIPLLRRELELAYSIRGGMHRLGKTDGAALSRGCQERLARRVESLLNQQQQNRQLLTRRGVRIHGPA